MSKADGTITQAKKRKQYLHLRFEGDLIVDKRGMVYGVKVTGADKLIVPYGSRS